MAQVLGLGGVFFRSSNPRKLARWYSRSLGIPLAFPTGTTFKVAAMPRQSQLVWSAFPAATRYFAPSGSSFMVNFVVDDVEAALKQVVAAGGKQVGKMRASAYGTFGWFLDPEDNKVELWQPAKPKPRKGK